MPLFRSRKLRSSQPARYTIKILHNFHALHTTVHSMPGDVLEFEGEGFCTQELTEAGVVKSYKFEPIRTSEKIAKVRSPD